MNPLKTLGDYSLSTVFGTFIQAKGKAEWLPSIPQEPRVEDFVQTDEDGVTEYSSIGPGYNEASTFYQYGTGAHHIRFLNLVSPDIILVHQSKLVGFYKVLKSPDELQLVQRDVKNLMVKDTNITL